MGCLSLCPIMKAGCILQGGEGHPIKKTGAYGHQLLPPSGCRGRDYEGEGTKVGLGMECSYLQAGGPQTSAIVLRYQEMR